MNLFSEVYAGQYDGLYASKNYKKECDLVEEAVRRYAKSGTANLLDIGCGTGGHAIEMSKRGYAVTGIDLSQEMVELAIKKSEKEQLSKQPQWVCGDVRDFAAGEKYELAIMMFAVIGYLTSNSDVLAGLRNIRQHLKPGALFICDFWSGPSVLSVRPADRIREVKTKEGRIIRSASTELDIATHTAAVTFKLWALSNNLLVGETTETHNLRYFFPQEFSLFLSSAGFKLLSLTAFPSLDDPLKSETWNALAVAMAIDD